MAKAKFYYTSLSHDAFDAVKSTYANGIVFLKSSSEIWAQGTYFGITPTDKAKLEQVVADEAALETTVDGLCFFKNISSDGGTTKYSATDKEGTIVFSGSGLTVECSASGVSITATGATVPLTGYSKATAAGAVAATDTVNAAIGKLEYKADNVDANIDAKIAAQHTLDQGEFVAKETGKGLMTDEEKSKLAAIEAGAQVNVIETVKVNGTALSVSSKAVDVVAVTSATTGDKVLTVSTAGDSIGATLSLKYVAADKKMYLYGKDETSTNLISEVDCSDFIKDGILWGQKMFTASATSQEVSITVGDVTKKHTFTDLTVGHQYLALCFTNGASASPTFSWEKIDVTSLIDVYTAGSDISITSNEISVSLGETITAKGLQANVGHIANGDTIAAGSSLTDILKQILTKTLYPGVATQASLTQGISSSFTNGAVLELGTGVTSASVTLNPSNGAYNCAAGALYSGIGAPNTAWTEQTFGDVTWTAGSATPETLTGGTASGNSKSWTGLSYKVAIGTNTMAVAQSSATATISNLPKDSDNADYTTDKYSKGGAGAAALVSSGSKNAAATSTSCTGVWPCFTNITGSAYTSSPTSKLGIQTSATFTLNNVPTEVGSANNFMFAYPDGYSVSAFKIKDLQGNWVPFAGTYTASAGDITKTMLDGTSKTYHYLTTGGGNGTGSYQITLNQTLDN